MTSEEQMNESARKLGQIIGSQLPEDVGFGFFLVTKGEGGFMSWISNMEREDMFTAIGELMLKEGFVNLWDEQEDGPEV